MNSQAITRILEDESAIDYDGLYEIVHDYRNIPADVIVHYEYESVLDWIDSIPNNDNLYEMLEDDKDDLLELIKGRNSDAYNKIIGPFTNPRFVIDRLVECYNEFVEYSGEKFGVTDELEIEHLSDEDVLGYYPKELAIGALEGGWADHIIFKQTVKAPVIGA